MALETDIESVGTKKQTILVHNLPELTSDGTNGVPYRHRRRLKTVHLYLAGSSFSRPNSALAKPTTAAPSSQGKPDPKSTTLVSTLSDFKRECFQAVTLGEGGHQPPAFKSPLATSGARPKTCYPQWRPWHSQTTQPRATSRGQGHEERSRAIPWSHVT